MAWLQQVLMIMALWLVGCTFAATQKNNQTISEFLDKLMQGYDRLRPPLKNASTRVELGVYVNSFYSISEQTMDYSVNIYLRQNWTDPRLAFEPDPEAEIGDMIKLDEHFYRKIWLPDIFIRNEKRANFHEVTIPNRLMRLYSNGAVWYVTKITATLDCYMDLTNYPLDVQKCPLSLESFGNTMDVLTFKWMDNAVEKDENLRLPEYTLKSFDFQDCSRVYAAGAFPCLNVDFFLDRNREYFVMQVYLPSVLIVIMSWVGFWISIDASPARVSIGLLTVLTITTQATASRASQPKVSYIKAIDVWLAMCLLFVFASLLEYSLVNTFSRRQIPKPVRNRAQGIFCNSNSEKKKMCDDLQPHVEAAPEKEEVNDPHGREKAKRVDTVSRVLFPFSFILFCFVYGLYYVVFTRSSYSV